MALAYTTMSNSSRIWSGLGNGNGDFYTYVGILALEGDLPLGANDFDNLAFADASPVNNQAISTSISQGTELADTEAPPRYTEAISSNLRKRPLWKRLFGLK